MVNIVDELSKLSGEFYNLVKLGVGEKRKAIEIQKLTENVGKYIHFSDSDRAGISFNKNVHPGNPRGFYGLPLSSDIIKEIVDGNRDFFGEYGHRKYIYVFDVTGNILNLDNFDLEVEFNKLLNYVKESDLKYKSTLSWIRLKDLQGSRQSYKLLWFMTQIVRMLGVNEHSAMNSLYRKLGYDIVITNTGGLGDGIEEQVVALTPTSINILCKLENPLGLTRQEIKEEEQYQVKLKAKREEYERARAKEKEEIKARRLERERKDKEEQDRRAQWEKDEQDRLAKWKEKWQLDRQDKNKKTVEAKRTKFLQSMLKTGKISITDIDTLKDLADVAFIDYAKPDARAIKQAGTILAERGLPTDNICDIIRLLISSTKL